MLDMSVFSWVGEGEVHTPVVNILNLFLQVFIFIFAMALIRIRNNSAKVRRLRNVHVS